MEALSALAETCTGTLAKEVESSYANMTEKWLGMTDQVKVRFPSGDKLEDYCHHYTSSKAKLLEMTVLLDEELPKIQTALNASKGDLLNTPTCLSHSYYKHPLHADLISLMTLIPIVTSTCIS